MMGEITEEQLQKAREPIPFTPTKRLKRDDVLYVTENDIPHPVYGYARSHKEYGVIDLRGYRKGYEPRLEISGIYTPSSTDTFRLVDGHLPPYQPTTTGDKLLAEMRRLGIHKAFRIGKLEEVPAVSEVVTVPEDFEHTVIGRTPAGEANLLQTPEGELIERIASGEKRGWWKILVGRTEYVGKTPADVLNLARRKEAIPKALPVKPPAVSVVEYDRRYSLEELREMARQAGLSPSGSKKEIAARLIAKGVK